ncbi:MAG: chemotaxis protein CheD [Firmicutes bacterium]|jgi:chemotaxis protein CheD|nr:chemotaxis protein CheD [Bacillota bacterium]
MSDKQLVVGIADMKICRGPGKLITYALGSCIGICFYDPMIRLGGMVHIMLPNNMEGNNSNVFKYADTGIPATLRKLEVFGGVRARMVCKIAGGAKMFEVQGNNSIGNIGQRNIETVKKVLAKEGIRVAREDVGLNYARTLLLDAETGVVLVRSFGRKELVL